MLPNQTPNPERPKDYEQNLQGSIELLQMAARHAEAAQGHIDQSNKCTFEQHAQLAVIHALLGIGTVLNVQALIGNQNMRLLQCVQTVVVHPKGENDGANN